MKILRWTFLCSVGVAASVLTSVPGCARQGAGDGQFEEDKNTKPASGSETGESKDKDKDNDPGFDVGNTGQDGPDFAIDAAGGRGGESRCSEEAKRIYVLSAQHDLYSFWPPTLEFKKVGSLTCDRTSGPFSMAVDRSGTAFVLYKNGRVFRVSTTDASCTPTAFSYEQAGIDKFGMGFSADSSGSDEETLYVASFSGFFGKIDTNTMKLTKLGAFPNSETMAFAELTGTGDGRLYGFFYGAPGTLKEIQKSNATLGPEESLGSLSTGSAFAFSFWGGDFFFYTADAANTAKPFSDVTRYRPATKALETVKSQVGFRIVGAGVSTCAPTSPIK